MNTQEQTQGVKSLTLDEALILAQGVRGWGMKEAKGIDYFYGVIESSDHKRRGIRVIAEDSEDMIRAHNYSLEIYPTEAPVSPVLYGYEDCRDRNYPEGKIRWFFERLLNERSPVREYREITPAERDEATNGLRTILSGERK